MWEQHGLPTLRVELQKAGAAPGARHPAEAVEGTMLAACTALE
jgi:hypothetical protein